MNITPPNASVLLGNTQIFTATVANASDTTVLWTVNGMAGGNASVGMITPTGTYTAPADLPTPVVVQVTATSQADATKSASANVTIASDIALAVTPNLAGVELGATQNFQAVITSAGRPDLAVRWSVSGKACPAGCGSVDANGNYTAPQVLPTAAAVTLTAQSVADPSKRASSTVTITSNFTLQISGPASVTTGGSATLAATLTPLPGSKPSMALTWSVFGSGCSGASCGVLHLITAPSVGANPETISAAYSAPTIVPNPNTVTITVTPQADPSKKAQVPLMILPGIGVSLSPGAATLAANHRVTLTARIFGTPNGALQWSVNGIANGSGTLGQICAVGTNPCQPLPAGNNSQVDYQAPGAIPSVNPVTVQATSVADATKSASAQITVLNHVIVTVQPANVTLAPLAAQGFTASVLGTSNQNVVWQIQGTACAGTSACGSVDVNGTYIAPGAAPSPDNLQVVAISADDAAQSGDANVAISTGANILTLHPASVYAGGVNGFTLRVDGSNFVPTSASTGSVLVIAGTSRTTTCATALECTAPVTPADVALPGNVSVQLRNADGSASNAVTLVIVPPNSSDEAISLTGAAPASTGKDIVVVEPTTAGVSAPGADLDLNVAALGAFSLANNSCVLAGNPVSLQRPASGTATAEICLFSASGLDASMTYLVSGPSDVIVISKQPAGRGIIHLTLQVPATALPGARTLFIQNTNLDKAAASGALEVY